MGVGVAHAADDIIFTYGDAAYATGTGGKKAETVDVAMLLQDDALVGLQVKAVRVPFASTKGLSNASAWLSVELPAIKSTKAGDPDVCSKSFELAEGYTEVTFDQPYTITAEGIYVGYSFDMAAVDDDVALQPIPLTGSTSPKAFFIHSTKIFRTAWRDRYPDEGQLCLQVALTGDAVKTNAVGISRLSGVNTQAGEPTAVVFDIVNQGTAGISSIDYTVSINHEENGDVHHADLSVKGIFGASATVELTLPAIPQKGINEYTVSIEKVNGQPNENANATATAQLNVYTVLPIHRPVLEEYTGTWCGYCPRGFVGLEEMNRLYPDDFIGLSYHNGDPMQVTTDYPSRVSGFPDAWIDRWYQTDAFSGDARYGAFGIDKVWQTCREIFAPAAVDVSSEWTDENTLHATAAVTFPLSAQECPYQVAFVLTADGLSGESSEWNQANYYKGAEGWPASMNAFIQGGESISGLVYNDVVIECSTDRGIPGSLTAPIEENVTQSVSHDFDLSAIKPAILPADLSHLRVNALLIDTRTGNIVNANKAYAGTAPSDAIGQLAFTQDEVVERTLYFDLQGRRISRPTHGFYIKAETLRNGLTRTCKVRF